MNSIQDYLTATTMLLPATFLLVAIIFSSLWNLFFPEAKNWTPRICLLVLIASAISFWSQFPVAPTYLFGSLYTVDNLSVATGFIATIIGAIIVMMSMGYEKHFGRNQGEYYVLIVTAVLAVCLLGGATDIVMLFVGLETLSLCCVLLSGVMKQDRKSNEAALKYLLSTAATTATLLYGFSFIYGLTGSTNYYELHLKLAALTQTPSLLVMLGLMFVLSGIGFKLAAVPFHMWAPDVYEGAPTPVTAFLAIGSKLGGFVVAIRLLVLVFGSAYLDWSLIVGTLAILSMIAGNLIALAQTSFKRMLAYSSIAHVGYILLGLIADPKDGLPAVMFYLIVYGFMNLGAFAGAIIFENETGSDNINDFAGLIRKRPVLATGLAICLVNLAGLPIPPAGFFAKVFVFWSAVNLQTTLGWALVATALVTSVPAIYYYTRVVIKMVVREPSEKVLAMPDKEVAMPGNNWVYAAMILCLIGITFGSFKVDSVMDISRAAVNTMAAPPTLGSLPSHTN
ncbi:MAG: NADH-quinone oxidoreductase subunit NuoN [Candidatus Obscuribacterales bacterium]|nr:NADH-quinone oxidoreductase subunit NuoN [Candidatus Obscuribacterales bacterium]